jgi:hypothetical protein
MAKSHYNLSDFSDVIEELRSGGSQKVVFVVNSFNQAVCKVLDEIRFSLKLPIRIISLRSEFEVEQIVEVLGEEADEGGSMYVCHGVLFEKIRRCKPSRLRKKIRDLIKLPSFFSNPSREE